MNYEYNDISSNQMSRERAKRQRGYLANLNNVHSKRAIDNSQKI